MNCDKNNLSPIRLEWDTGQKLWPNEVKFQYSSSKYNFLRCQFDSTASEKIKDDFFNLGDGRENRPYQPVEVYVDNELMRTMYFEPNFIDLGDEEQNYAKSFTGQLELHDLHTQLKKGNIVYRPNQEDHATVYAEILNRRKKPVSHPNTIKGIFLSERSFDTGEVSGRSAKIKSADNWQMQGSIPTSDDDVSDKWEANDTLEYENLTPFEALNKTHEKTGRSSGVMPEGLIYIGPYPFREPSDVYSASTSGSLTDLHIKSGNLSNHINSYNMVIAEGPPPASLTLEAFNQNNDVHISEDNSRVEAVAKIQGKEQGKVEKVKSHNTNVDELAQVATDKLETNIEQNNKNSQLTVSGFTSNKSPTINIGDILEVDDSFGVCTNEKYPGGTFLVSGVEHKYRNSWDVDLALRKINQDITINVGLRVMDFENDQSYNYNDLYGYDPFEGFDL